MIAGLAGTDASECAAHGSHGDAVSPVHGAVEPCDVRRRPGILAKYDMRGDLARGRCSALALTMPSRAVPAPVMAIVSKRSRSQCRARCVGLGWRRCPLPRLGGRRHAMALAYRRARRRHAAQGGVRRRHRPSRCAPPAEALHDGTHANQNSTRGGEPLSDIRPGLSWCLPCECMTYKAT